MSLHQCIMIGSCSSNPGKYVETFFKHQMNNKNNALKLSTLFQMITVNKSSFITLVFTICPPHRFEGVDVNLGFTLLGIKSPRWLTGKWMEQQLGIPWFIPHGIPHFGPFVFIDVSVSKVYWRLSWDPSFWDLNNKNSEFPARRNPSEFKGN